MWFLDYEIICIFIIYIYIYIYLQDVNIYIYIHIIICISLYSMDRYEDKNINSYTDKQMCKRWINGWTNKKSTVSIGDLPKCCKSVHPGITWSLKNVANIGKYHSFESLHYKQAAKLKDSKPHYRELEVERGAGNI